MISLKKITQFNFILVSLIAFSILFLDKPIATFIANNLSGVKPFFLYVTNVLDTVFYHIIWYLILCIVCGVCFIFNNNTRRISFAFFTIVLATIGAYGIITAKMKTEFKRARPEVYLIGDGNTSDFFNEKTKDYSFPSSHVAFYLSLSLPLALIFRQYIVLILIIPAIITIGRVFQNVHYLSDVLCSILIVLNFCILSFWILHQMENIWIRIKTKRKIKNITANVA